MKEHPILFTGPMVRAILEGRKTQTRRPIKTPWCRAPVAVGDRLWVRETFSYLTTTEERHYNDTEGRSRCSEYDRVLTPEDFADGPWEDGPAGPIAYKASHTDEEIKSWGVHREVWRPSIHMPRWASRLTLEVTGIRPERVKSIPQSDALAEGIEYRRAGGMSPGGSGTYHVSEEHHASTPKEAFACLWDSIYGKGPLAWKLNPWVWATTFKVVTK